MEDLSPIEPCCEVHRGLGGRCSVPVEPQWTRADRHVIERAIRGWWTTWVFYAKPGVTKTDVFAKMPEGERARIVITHLRDLQAMHDKRADDYWVAAENARTTTAWGEFSTELVERFTKLAENSRTLAVKVGTLAARISLEGLPADLLGYVP